MSEIRGRLGIKASLRNLASGIKAPASGHDNPHYFDNAAMIRALGIVSAFKGSEPELLKLVEEDASHTHSEDGVWAAIAIAILAHRILNGAPIIEAIEGCIKALPEESWGYREVNKAISITSKSSSINDRVYLLERDFIDRIYPYPYAAPETLGLICAHLIHNPSPELMFASAFHHRRHTDSLPVFIGFFMGLIHGDSWMPKTFLEQEVVMDGVSFEGGQADLVCEKWVLSLSLHRSS
jgi:ADP-ribosylglycohydrolase